MFEYEVIFYRHGEREVIRFRAYDVFSARLRCRRILKEFCVKCAQIRVSNNHEFRHVCVYYLD